jgi:hypothetical protein
LKFVSDHDQWNEGEAGEESDLDNAFHKQKNVVDFGDKGSHSDSFQHSTQKLKLVSTSEIEAGR